MIALNLGTEASTPLSKKRENGFKASPDLTRLEETSLGHDGTEWIWTPQSRRWQVLAAETSGEGQPSTV